MKLFQMNMMTDEEGVMKLENLPNEILMKCFQYLNSFEIFYSFDQLNHRFHTLIHTIPLSINFDHVTKRMFDRFCQSNSASANQISSLKISNTDQCFQAKLFLSYFPWVELSSLEKFQLIIPIDIWDSESMYGEKADPTEFYLQIKISDFFVLQLRTLTIPYLCRSLFDIDPILSVINLIISNFSSKKFRI